MRVQIILLSCTLIIFVAFSEVVKLWQIANGGHTYVYPTIIESSDNKKTIPVLDHTPNL